MKQRDFYNNYVKPELIKDDKPFNRQLYNDLKDMLCKDGVITQKQFNEWVYPDNKYFE